MADFQQVARNQRYTDKSMAGQTEEWMNATKHIISLLGSR